MDIKLVLPCLRGVLGDWVFYSTIMSASDISKWIHPVKNIREADSLDALLQRDLKDRKKAISKYLLTDKSRFFNSIVVGVFGGVPDWFEFDYSGTFNTIPESYTQSIKDSMGLMVFNGSEQMFAIDGQHRVAGIDIAVKADKGGILNEDSFSVILVAHLDDELGMKRTRKLFSDINKNAKPVAGGDKIKIDEQDLCAIVTRRLYANYSHFQNGRVISLTENAKLEKDDIDHFTNLLGLHNTNKVLKKIFKKERNSQEWDEENVQLFLKIAEDFYDFAINHVEHYKRHFIDKTLGLPEARRNNAYLLFRPVGLKLIAGVYVHFFNKPSGLEILKEKINRVSFVLPDSPFDKVLWNNGKMEAKEKNQKLALDLLLYILGETEGYSLDDLLIRYRDIVKNAEATLPLKLVVD